MPSFRQGFMNLRSALRTPLQARIEAIRSTENGVFEPLTYRDLELWQQYRLEDDMRVLDLSKMELGHSSASDNFRDAAALATWLQGFVPTFVHSRMQSVREVKLPLLGYKIQAGAGIDEDPYLHMSTFANNDVPRVFLKHLGAALQGANYVRSKTLTVVVTVPILSQHKCVLGCCKEEYHQTLLTVFNEALCSDRRGGSPAIQLVLEAEQSAGHAVVTTVAHSPFFCSSTLSPADFRKPTARVQHLCFRGICPMPGFGHSRYPQLFLDPLFPVKLGTLSTPNRTVTFEDVKVTDWLNFAQNLYTVPTEHPTVDLSAIEHFIIRIHLPAGILTTALTAVETSSVVPSGVLYASLTDQGKIAVHGLYHGRTAKLLPPGLNYNPATNHIWVASASWADRLLTEARTAGTPEVRGDWVIELIHGKTEHAFTVKSL